MQPLATFGPHNHDWPAFCHVCGDAIILYDPELYEECCPELQCRLEEDDYVSGHLSELENMHIRHSDIWRGLYRAGKQLPIPKAVMDQADWTVCYSHDDVYLTGVGVHMPPDYGVWAVLRNRNEFWIGPPSTDPEKFVEGYDVELGDSPPSFEDSSPYGYLIHERCWATATRFLNIDLILANLDLFVK
ncbi:hypothetical protein BO94DRAFT_588319 [Aspergillus sclerotioniger CBS 115572]|uniref:Uncharacterized protein n=1 Tax=Aspergillus sclerotioniger CBS 115572 TaxID=1450535 RepID=A0A317VUH7_9EURO|nr:hypothetical protein BO94DRAFT_588319 [Aspergillus sclerotioniger CBS 115572]PWY78016.1 hypothetical protein BO94DRAFT_588319 [Aspergillus sclerotioniger CBS 115572]